MKKVSFKIYIFLIILINLEICCLNCFYENLHNGHKLIRLSDSENLAKENISME